MGSMAGQRTGVGQGQPIRIGLLGGVRVQGLRGQGLGSTEGRTHARALIALAGSSARGVSRDEVADALWPRQGEQAARNRLYHTVHLVRQALSALAWNDDWIVIQHGQVLFDPRVACDAHVLEALADSPERHDDTSILQALEHCDGEWAPEVEAGAFGQTIRRVLHDCRVTVLREGARRLAARGDTPARRDLLQRILSLRPTDEWAYQQLMAVELDADRPHAALRMFDAARRAMAAQLGLRPSAALVELLHRANARLKAPQGSSPAADRTALIGRGTLLSELAAELRAGSGVWVLHGLAGVGKNALARELARRVDLPMRWWTVPPGERADDHLASFWEDLHAAEPPGSNAPDRPPALHVVDQLDLAADGWAQLGRLAAHQGVADAPVRRLLLLHNAPALRPWPAGWHAVPVLPLDLPAADARPADGRQSPAVALFQMLRPSPDADVNSEADWRDLVALVRRLDGLPLALELAAARMATLTPGELLRQLDGPAGLGALDPPVPNDQPTLAHSLEQSLRQLSDPARALYRLLSVFQGPFTEDAAVRLSEQTELKAPADWPLLLEELRGLGLLVGSAPGAGAADSEADPLPAPLRLLHLVRDQGRRESRALGLWPAHFQAHVDVMIARLEARACSVEDPGYLRWMNEVATLHDEALLLLAPVLKADPRRYLRLLVPLAQSWALRLLPLSLLQWIDAGLQQARALGQHDVAVQLGSHAARLCLESRALEDALRYSLEALQGTADGVDLLQRRHVIATRALVIKATGSLREALDLLAEALKGVAPHEPGQACLMAAQASLWPAPLAEALARQGDSKVMADPMSPWRERLAGSRLWWDMLTACSEAAANPYPRARLAAARELLATARGLQSVRRVEMALARIAWVQLALDEVADTTATVYEWYEVSRSADRSLQAALACVWLAEVAWRQHDGVTAGRWLDDARRLLQDDPASTVHQSIHAHAMAVAALGGDVEEGARMLLALGAETIARCATFPLLELATEAGALLARRAGLEHLARSLADSLSRLTHPNNVVPLVLRLRQKEFGEPAAPELTPQAIDAASAQARADLKVLHEYFESARRRVRPG